MDQVVLKTSIQDDGMFRRKEAPTDDRSHNAGGPFKRLTELLGPCQMSDRFTQLNHLQLAQRQLAAQLGIFLGQGRQTRQRGNRAED